MDVLPAIDLRGGRCVRLLRGEADRETRYGDPVELARAYGEAGAPMLHVVDLDAAMGGLLANRPIVERIVEAAGAPVEYAGGVRDEAVAAELLSSGVARVVVGTAAVEQPDLVRRLAERFPGRVVLGLDHRRVASGGGVTRREVAVRGWARATGLELLEALAPFEDLPLSALVVTDISRDGTLLGPDVAGYRLLLEHTALPVIASGGIGSAADLAELSALEVAGRRLAGAVVGKALLDGRLTLEEAMAACAS